MIAAAQSGLLALHKLKSTGPQTVTVQHVHVTAGGQAVVENIQSNPARKFYRRAVSRFLASCQQQHVKS